MKLRAQPKVKPLVDAKGEVREIKAADLKAFRPVAEVLPVALRRKIGVRRSRRADEVTEVDCDA